MTDAQPEAARDGSFAVELWPGESVRVESAEAAARGRRYRDVLARFASGVTVVTATRDGEPVGMTCQSFMAVSLEPPLVVFAPARTSGAWPQMRETGAFCVNLLAADQGDVAARMALRSVDPGTGERIDKFVGVPWSPSLRTGSPLLAGVLGYVDCAIEDVHDAGDHLLVVGRVLDLDESEAEHGLTFFRSRYGSTGG